MVIKDVRAKYNDVEIDLLLSAVLKKPREFLYLHPDYRLNPRQITQISQMAKRRKNGEPIAYIVGYKDFMGARFKVNPDVLIPRPESEGLVERVFSSVIPEFVQDKYPESIYKVIDSRFRGNDSKRVRDGKITILDVGTGSGNIIISLAKLFSPSFLKRGPGGVKFYASDISNKALAVARQNAKKHHVRVKFIYSDLLKGLRIFPDIIVANLPYVPVTDYNHLRKNLKYEPKAAIFAKEKGLALIEALLRQISKLKKHPKLIFLEFDPKQKTSLSKLAKKHLPDAKAKFYKDLNGRWRNIIIRI